LNLGDLIDNKKYFKILPPYCTYWYQISDLPKFEDRKLSVFAGTIFRSNDPCSQYHERAVLIDFLEEKSEGDFNFYGPCFPGSMNYRSYKGAIAGGPNRNGFLPKIHVIKNYRFDFCFENTKNVNGFITERMFESLSAGCIPVYSGIKNIEKYFPKNCFIAKNDFKNYDELYTFIKTMSKETYEKYRDNIKNFLASDAAYRISTPYYVKCVREVLGLDKVN